MGIGTAALPEGYILGERYAIERVLGEGGFGITYRASDLIEGKSCCIKEYFPSGQCCRLPDESIRPASPDAAEQFKAGADKYLQEYSALLRLKEFPEVVDVYDLLKINGTLYIVMELLAGTDLNERRKAKNPAMTAGEALSYVASLAAAFDRIHKKTSIIHCDISPENVIVTRDGRLKIIDFGASQFTRINHSTYKVFKQFRPDYAPPEQYSFKVEMGTFTDVYSLASTGYYLISGRSIPKVSERKKGNAYQPLSALGLGIPQCVSDAFDHALEMDIGRRTKTMAAFLAEMQDTSGQAVQPGKAVPSGQAVSLGKAVSPEKAGNEQKTVYIRVTHGSCKNMQWNLPPDMELVIGRVKEKANIVIPEPPSISRAHCVIRYNSGDHRVMLRDISQNGVSINGTRIPRDRIVFAELPFQMELANGDCRLRIGMKND